MPIDWPSPVQNNKVPTLTDIIASGSPACAHAAKLLAETHQLASNGDQLRFQEVFLTDSGAVCLPALATRQDGSRYILFSHAGAWTDEDISRLLHWVAQVRSVDELAELPVQFIADEASDAADEICDPFNRQILALLQSFGDNAALNAKLYGRAFFKQQTPSLAHLRQGDTAIIERGSGLSDTSPLKPAFVAGLGAYVGEVLVAELDMKWNADFSAVVFNDSEIDPFAKAEAFLGNPTEAAAPSAFVDIMLSARAADAGVVPAPPTSAFEEPPAPTVPPPIETLALEPEPIAPEPATAPPVEPRQPTAEESAAPPEAEAPEPESPQPAVSQETTKPEASGAGLSLSKMGDTGWDTVAEANHPAPEKKKAPPVEVSSSADDICQTIIDQQKRDEQREENSGDRAVKIEVDDSVSKLPLIYEKIRNSLDYQDHNLVFRNAIRRVLSRLIIARNPPDCIADTLSAQAFPAGTVKSLQRSLAGDHKESYDIAYGLITELIRGGYLHNHRVLESKAGELQGILDKYLKLQATLAAGEGVSASTFYDTQQWLIEMMSTEIAENISNDRNSYLKRTGVSSVSEWSIDTSDVVVKNLCRLINDNIYDDGRDEKFTKDKDLQIYVSIYKQLFKYNNQMNIYTVFRYLVPDWSGEMGDEKIAEVASRYTELRKQVDRHLDHPFASRIMRVASRYVVYFTFLKKSLEETPDQTLKMMKQSHASYQQHLIEICDEAYRESRKHLLADTMKCFVYILITKVIIIAVLEHPANMLFYPNIPLNLELFCLSINVAFPLLLLLIIGLFTSVPGRANTENILKGMDEILLGKKMDTKLVRLEYELGSFRLLPVYYAVLILIVYGALSALVNMIGFTVISTFIFLLFFTIISFLGLTLQRIAKAHRAIPPKPTLTGFIAEQFYLPILAVGKWVSDLIASNNVFIIVMDHFIEGTIKRFVDSVERWTSYMKEKREDAMG